MDKAKPRAMEIIEEYCREARKAERTRVLQLIEELRGKWQRLYEQRREWLAHGHGDFDQAVLKGSVERFEGATQALDELRKRVEGVNG